MAQLGSLDIRLWGRLESPQVNERRVIIYVLYYNIRIAWNEWWEIESLLLEAGFTSAHLFFTVEEANSVRLFGMVNSAGEKEAIETLVKKIKEIKNIKNELVVLTGSMRGE